MHTQHVQAYKKAIEKQSLNAALRSVWCTRSMCRHAKRPLKNKVSTLHLDQFDAHAACAGIQKGHWNTKYQRWPWISLMHTQHVQAYKKAIEIQSINAELRSVWCTRSMCRHAKRPLKNKVSTLHLDQFDAHAACAGIQKGHWNTKYQRWT